MIQGGISECCDCKVSYVGSTWIFFMEKTIPALNKLIQPFKNIFKKSVREIHLTSPRTQEKSINLILLSDIHSPDNFFMNEVNPQEFDLVLLLGDINEPTVDYILNQARFVRVYGIYGNHDPKTIAGMDAMDGKILFINGYKIGGISGVNEHYHCVHSYSEEAVQKKLNRLGPVDILVTHAPPYSISKDEDRVHQGFKALDDYILRYNPKYVYYGHLHSRQRHRIGQTEVVGIAGKEFVRING